MNAGKPIVFGLKQAIILALVGIAVTVAVALSVS